MDLAPDATQQLPTTPSPASPPAAIPSAATPSPAGPPPPQEPYTWPTEPSKSPQPRQRRRLAETAGVALLAAVLASGGTYALTNGEAAPAPAATTSQTQANTNNGTATSPTVVPGNGSAPNWSAVAGAVAPSVVSIDVRTSQGGAAGSGVIFDAKGHILTNNHVVGDAVKGSILVTLADGRAYQASIVGTDPSTDLAVIKLDSGPSDLTPITLGDSTKLVVGDPVMAIGNPLGLSGTVTTGIVSALNRPVSTGDSAPSSPFGQQAAPAQPVVTNAIQTSAAINPGNSGGALVNDQGQLVGINSAIAQLGATSASGQSGNIGIGFAIPVKEAKSIADQLITKGVAEHAFIGVSIRDATVKDGSAQRAGAQVAAVTSGSPAAKAGLNEGDVIIEADGQQVGSAEGLIATVHEMNAGDAITLTVIRGGARQQVPVTLGVAPTPSN